MKAGSQLITEERQRQLETTECSQELDDEYKKGVLAMAGITYAAVATSSPVIREQFRERATQGKPIQYWPWDSEFLRVGLDDSHSARIRELTKAGALIAAEIDKLQREAKQAH